MPDLKLVPELKADAGAIRVAGAKADAGAVVPVLKLMPERKNSGFSDFSQKNHGSKY